jgi:hypothetical protein
VVWISGVKERAESTGRIVSDSREGATRRLVIESTDDGKSAFRDRYEFIRATR